jgi:hypothetical protein
VYFSTTGGRRSSEINTESADIERCRIGIAVAKYGYRQIALACQLLRKAGVLDDVGARLNAQNTSNNQFGGCVIYEYTTR